MAAGSDRRGRQVWGTVGGISGPSVQDRIAQSRLWGRADTRSALSAVLGGSGSQDGLVLWLGVAQPCTFQLPSFCRQSPQSLAPEVIPVWAMTLSACDGLHGGGRMNRGGVDLGPSEILCQRKRETAWELAGSLGLGVQPRQGSKVQDSRFGLPGPGRRRDCVCTVGCAYCGLLCCTADKSAAWDRVAPSTIVI